MLLGNEAFGSIRIGVSTVLMRQELNAALRRAPHRGPRARRRRLRRGVARPAAAAAEST